DESKSVFELPDERRAAGPLKLAPSDSLRYEGFTSIELRRLLVINVRSRPPSILIIALGLRQAHSQVLGVIRVKSKLKNPHYDDEFKNESVKMTAHISSLNQYHEMYKQSVDDPEKFWREIALKNFYWHEAPKEKNFLNYNFEPTRGRVYVEWMKGAVTNMCYNAVDRIIEQGDGDKVAYIWEANSPHEDRKITYNELKIEVSKFANVLKSKGIKKGSRVAIYMPVTIELVIAMLGCARIGAIHTVVFAGFSAEALSERMVDAKCAVLVTADGSYRGNKLIQLKEIAAEALEKCQKRNHRVPTCIVHRRIGLSVIVTGNGSIASSHLPNGQLLIQRPNHTNGISNTNNNNNNNNGTNVVATNVSVTALGNRHSLLKAISWNYATDIWWDKAMAEASSECEPVWMDAEDPLFILYTSGSTGKPKGVVHTTGGYMVYAATTFKYVFDYHDNDVFFCTADLGWITGHTVNVYGALCNGATITLFEGTPFHPDPGRLWQIVQDHQVNIFYTAPTAIRSLMKYSDRYVTRYNRSSLKLLGTAGEPINPEAWNWYYDVVGERRCPIVDTFWQTETSAPMLTPLPGATPLKPGSATLPFFGVQPAIVDENGRELEGPAVGHLVFKAPWPGMMRTIDGDHDRFEYTYFHTFPGYYATGDHVRRDADGYYWVLGRADDMLNVSGHLLSTAEVESALAEHKTVAEAAAVSFPHEIKGEAIFCYVVLKENYEFNEDIEHELKMIVRSKIGPLASPDRIRCLKQLPKTRSGKTMRRILRKASCGDLNLGDISTVAEQSALEELFPLGYRATWQQAITTTPSPSS
ncbi:Acetyl-coenzyme A synthetase, cytoplasmic, partial [Fragariocoptes setiger]